MISHQEIAKQLFHSTTNNKTGKPAESIFGLALKLGPSQYFKRKILLENYLYMYILLEIIFIFFRI